MKKKISKILCFGVILSGLTAIFVYTTDNNLKFNKSQITIFEDSDKKDDSLYWDGSAYLDDKEHSNITNYNNIFDDYPKITNDISNKESITIRAVNERGELICEDVTINPGETKELSKIPYNAGNITFQAKATYKGNYKVNFR